MDGRLWAYAVEDRGCRGTGPPAVAYLYAPDRKGTRPATHLAGFRGVLQVDGYGGFKTLERRRNDGSVVLAFCWITARPPTARCRSTPVGAGARSTSAAGNCRGPPTAVTQSKLL
jgi:hypothetical protein